MKSSRTNSRLSTKRSPAQVLAVLFTMSLTISVFAGTAGATLPNWTLSLRPLSPPPPVLPSAGRTLVPTRPFEVSLGASQAAVSPRHAARMTGSVMPSAPGKVVELQLRARGRWRTVSTGRLSRKSSFSLAARLTGAGGHFLRVVKLRGSGHAQGVSNMVEVIVAGRRTVHSHGGALSVTLGAATVSAPSGAIGKGQTLSISVGSRTGFGPENGASVAGGPYVVSTSQGEPKRPVTVTLRYDPGLLAGGDKPLFLHGLTATHSWVPEITTVHGQSASATLDSFSPMDIVDWGTYYAGILTGNRADLPGGCGATPSWIDSATLPDSNQDPLPVCFGSQSNDDEATLNIVNNRGYAQTITVSGAKVDVAKSIFAGSFEGQIGKLLAQLSSGNGPSAFVLGPGESATVAIDRPPPQQAALDIHIDPAAKTASGVGELAWALLTTAKDQVGVPLQTENCVLAAVYNTVSSDRGQDSAINQMHSCVDAASGLSGVAKDVLQKLAYGLLVDDFFYKVIDLEGDELYPAMIGFTIPGSNPTFTSPDIHISPLNLGTLPDGQTTTVQLTAAGGTAPYRFYIWNEPTNAAKVPSWVHLATDGTLTIEPPTSASGEVSFAVYAFDANGDHSPFAREEVRFQAFSGGGGPGGEDVTRVSAAPQGTCAVLGSGALYCWGAIPLGNGTSGADSCFPFGACSTTPVAVGSINTATSVAVGSFGNVCALLAVGTVECWGDNTFGELGNGARSESGTPVAVSGITNAIAIAAGNADTCAVLATGGVDCWGTNVAGELGDGTASGPETCDGSPCSTIPVPVSGITNAVAIDAGVYHTCALLSTGAIACWGEDDTGQLGSGNEEAPETCGSVPCSTTPVPVSGISDAIAIAGGSGANCALLKAGAVDCWGYSADGELGDGDETGPETCYSNPCSTTPVAVSGINNASAIGFGGGNGCAILSTGDAWCWGANSFGQLGNGSATDSDVPVEVSGISNAATSAVSGYDACVLLTTTNLECWGSRRSGSARKWHHNFE